MTHSNTWQATLEKAEANQRLSYDEGLVLYRDAPLHDLGRAAKKRRNERSQSDRVTYLIDRNINYSNVCITDCTFCNFYRHPGHAESYTHSKNVIGQKIQETINAGGTRILLQGGHNPDLKLSWYIDLLQWIKSEYPKLEIDCFSPSEIENIANIEHSDMETILRTLQQAGMDGLPGGGAEILDDEVRRAISPKKQPAAGWLNAMRIAQSLGMYTSATNVIGLGETIEQRMTHFQKIRDLQDDSLAAHGNGFPAFISWTAQLEGNPLGTLFKRREQISAGPTNYLRHLAFSRLFLDNIQHFQASWPTMGPYVAQVALEFGADDFGSTMLEENVVSSSGSQHSCMPEKKILHYIKQAGYNPAQRTSRYDIVRDFTPQTV